MCARLEKAIKCPKCGFDQPDDRFCAQCGVDVNLYNPRGAKPHPFQLHYILGVFALFSIGSAIYFILNKQPPGPQLPQQPRPRTVDQRLDSSRANMNLDQDPVEDNPIETSTAKAQTTEDAPSTQENDARTQPASPPIQSKELDPNATAVAKLSKGTANSKINSEAQEAPKSFRVSFYEVDHSYEANLLGTSLDGQSVIGNVPALLHEQNFESRLKFGIDKQQVRRIATTDQAIANEDVGMNVFNFTTVDPRLNAEVGLFLQIRPGEPAAQGFPLQIEGRRIMAREGQPEVINISREISLSKTSPIYITGLLPNRSPQDAAEANVFASNQFFSIYASEKFRNNFSDMIVIIEALNRP